MQKYTIYIELPRAEEKPGYIEKIVTLAILVIIWAIGIFRFVY